MKPKELILNEKIKNIHDSDLYGIIVECGNGCSIVNSLMSVEGATKTIFESKQPYSKEIQCINYGNEYTRSVSFDFVKAVLRKEKERCILIQKVNFILATSFQLGNRNDNNLTHGWIGFYHKTTNQEIYYHFSIPKSKSRKYYYNLISGIGINLLFSLTNSYATTNLPFSSKYIDQVIDVNSQCSSVEVTLKNTIYNTCLKSETFITITPNGIIRFEDLVRDKSGLILQKGSFNPLHQGHIDILGITQKEYPEYASAFILSTHRYDKEPIELNDLLNRIRAITEKGYNVIISKNPLFKNTLQWIRDSGRWNKLPIIFPIGVDTINRITEAEINEKLSQVKDFTDWKEYFKYLMKFPYKHVKFHVFKRQIFNLNENTNYFKKIIIFNEEYTDPLAISSSKIRNGEITL